MGKKLSDLDFSNRLYRDLPFLFQTVNASPLIRPSLLHTNEILLQSLELDSQMTANDSFLRFLNGDLEFEGLIFGASYYSGHQFGHYVPKLGDGRALMLGEIRTSQDNYFELQLKGSGLTPFSRMGDGRAVVRSSLREYLASAHLKALDVPTTEALAIIKGEDDVYRENIEKSAIVLRVAESFLRFGHFQFYSQTGQIHELVKLIEFAISNYFTQFENHPNQYVLFFQEVTKRTAKLFAKWQSIGFCHGVLNTDNMSILGLTLDYGPFGFIDHFDLDHICNHSDHEGRYSLGNQPVIGMWNLERLADALESIISKEDSKRVLETYPQIFHFEYRQLMLLKCGLSLVQASDEKLLKELLNMLVVTELDYTNFFRRLSSYASHSQELQGIQMTNELKKWLTLYDERLGLESEDEIRRHEKMLKTNPKFILRNYLAQIAIEDHTQISKIFDVLTNPFLEWDEVHEWSQPAPLKYKNLSVSCSS